MELELTARLTKPKTAAAELPMPETTDSPVADSPEFTILLEGAAPPKKPASEEPPTIPLQAQIPMTLPQEKLRTAIDQVKPEADNPVEPNAKTTPEKTADPKDFIAQSASTLPIAGPQIKPDLPIVDQPATAPSLGAPADKTGGAQAVAKPAPNVALPIPAPALAESPVGKTTPDPQQKLENTVTAPAPVFSPAPNAAAAPLAPLAPAQPMPTIKEANTDPAPDDSKLELSSRPAQPATKLAGQGLATPLTLASISNTETAKDDPTELQFGIKIERQATELAPTLRQSSQTPAPVSTQISTQLPQLLTKADKQTIELRLDPPELGRVTIHLKTNDQQVTALVVADRVDTVDLMRRHADMLTATLARAGFSQADLSFQQGTGGSQSDSSQHFQSFATIPESDDLTTPLPTLTGLDGRLDIRL